MRVILASRSPERKRLLERTGLKFDVVPSRYEEDMSLKLAPEELAKRLAFGKAREVAKRNPDAVVIGGDLFIVFKGKILGKPRSKEEAKHTLLWYRGQRVAVISSAVVVKGKEERSFVSTSYVTFRKDATETEIDAYIATGEPMDMAGSFTQESLGAPLVERCEGDYTATCGIPIFETLRMLRELGVNPLAKSIKTKSKLKKES